MTGPLALSVVVIGYNMARELPRTITTLAPSYQRDIAAEDYEIVVVDNGSTDGYRLDELHRIAPNLVVHRITDAPPSPVAAINEGLAMARGELVGVCIDGARMASPRLLASAREAARLHPRPVVGTVAFHLGPDAQARSILEGYDQAAEDALLGSVDWVRNGYRLYDVSVLAPSSARGWFEVPAETNALFLTRAHWAELGGYDPAFRAPGGGLANLDLWARLCADPTAGVMLLLGEATFHQVHGGIATNAAVRPWPEFHEEYVRIRGKDYERPQRRLVLVGRFPDEALPTVHRSVERFCPAGQVP